MKTCPKCGELNGEDRTTCFSCRKVLQNTAPYQKVCPKCRTIYLPRAERCEDCGGQLAVYDPVVTSAYARQSVARWWHYVIAIFLPLIGLIMALYYLGQGDNDLAKTMLTTVVACAVIQIVLGVLLAACGMLA